jgi:hypothetical protein
VAAIACLATLIQARFLGILEAAAEAAHHAAKHAATHPPRPIVLDLGRRPGFLSAPTLRMKLTKMATRELPPAIADTHLNPPTLELGADVLQIKIHTDTPKHQRPQIDASILTTAILTRWSSSMEPKANANWV